MKYKWTLILLGLTPLIALVVIVLVGGGHGTVYPLTVLYPALVAFDKIDNADAVTWIILIGQFPFYGFIIDLSIWKSKRLLLIGLLLLQHCLLLILALKVLAELGY